MKIRLKYVSSKVITPGPNRISVLAAAMASVKGEAIFIEKEKTNEEGRQDAHSYSRNVVLKCSNDVEYTDYFSVKRIPESAVTSIYIMCLSV